MKSTSALSAVFILSLAACDTMNRPISSGDFDPLHAPGSGSNLNMAISDAFTPGQIVRASMNNTAFFKNRPKGDADAEKLLIKGTSMKVVSTSDSYVKVELDGTGEVGWVPSVQLEDPRNAGAVPVGNPGEYQIYPPVDNGVVSPLPPLNPAEVPPNGAIPTVIDPDAPANGKPVNPPATLPKDGFPAPVVPKKESTPLPPNGEDEKTEKPAEATPKLEN